MKVFLILYNFLAIPGNNFGKIFLLPQDQLCLSTIYGGASRDIELNESPQCVKNSNIYFSNDIWHYMDSILCMEVFLNHTFF